MSGEMYDQVAAGVVASQSEADGFVAHYAIVEDGGITVIEIWDSVAQHDAWFNEAVAIEAFAAEVLLLVIAVFFVTRARARR